MKIYEARETGRMTELDGLELADFGQRAGAFLIDALIAFLALAIVAIVVGLAAWAWETGGDTSKHRSYHFNAEDEGTKIVWQLLVPVLYWGLTTYFGNGRTPGKRLFGIRVVSLVHEHMTFWHSVERALGYGAATLELGFGFVQFFLHPFRRCAQDRLAETIVVKERAFRARFEKTHAGAHSELGA